MLRLRLIGSALLATGLFLPALPASAYYSGGSVSTFGYSGTSVQSYTTAPPPLAPTTPPSSAGQSSGGTPTSTASGSSQGSITYFGGTSPITSVTPQKPSSGTTGGTTGATTGGTTGTATGGTTGATTGGATGTATGGTTGAATGGSYGTSPIIYWNAGGGTPPTPQSTSPITVVGPTSGLTGNPPANEAALVSQFLAMVNQARVQNGAQPLTENAVLDGLAQAKAKDLVVYNYFDHYSPRLGWPIDQEEAAGFRAYSMGAENLAETANVSTAFAMLMASPLHRENILDTAFTQTGIAIVPVTNGVLVDEFFTGPSY